MTIGDAAIEVVLAQGAAEIGAPQRNRAIAVDHPNIVHDFGSPRPVPRAPDVFAHRAGFAHTLLGASNRAKADTLAPQHHLVT